MYKVGLYIESRSGTNKNINVYNNLIHDIRYKGGSGSGIEIASELPDGNNSDINLYNNIIYNINGNYAFEINPYYSNNTINNISFNSNTIRTKPVLLTNYANASVSNITLKNNIFTSIQDEIGVTKDHNWKTDSQGAAGFVNESGYDYHLTSTAVVIDAGTSYGAPQFDYDGVSRPQGAGYDIGAYEFRIAS